MKVAIIDSGVHPGHPHVGAIAGGVHVGAQGLDDDFVDRLGHGTAVAGAIRERAPEAEIYAVKVFDRRLAANIDTILRALAWCVEARMDVINLSLGSDNPAYRERFEHALAGAGLVVSPAGTLPGLLSGVIAVASDTSCPRDVYRYRDELFYASPYPRPIPGVPVEKNLHGVSFAVANMTGFVARALLRGGVPRESFRERLIAEAGC